MLAKLGLTLKSKIDQVVVEVYKTVTKQK